MVERVMGRREGKGQDEPMVTVESVVCLPRPSFAISSPLTFVASYYQCIEW